MHSYQYGTHAREGVGLEHSCPELRFSLLSTRQPIEDARLARRQHYEAVCVSLKVTKSAKTIRHSDSHCTSVFYICSSVESYFLFVFFRFDRFGS